VIRLFSNTAAVASGGVGVKSDGGGDKDDDRDELDIIDKAEIELSSLMHGRKNLERRDSVNDEVKDNICMYIFIYIYTCLYVNMYV
jgi:hypothetical protein